MNLPYYLLAGQLVAMTSVFTMIPYATPFEWLIALIVYFCIMTFGISMGYHRYFSHKMFKCPVWFEYVMLFFAHLMMVGPVIVWVANHRQHHRFTDTENDPHSPKHKGYFYSYFLQVITKIEFKYVRDLLKVNRYRMQVKYYWHVLFAWAGVLLLIDPFAIVYAWLAPAGLAKIIGSLVFSYSHRSGEPHDDWLVGMLTFGEGFHRQHHDKPSKVVWHNHDITGMMIKAIDRNVKT